MHNYVHSVSIRRKAWELSSNYWKKKSYFPIL